MLAQLQDTDVELRGHAARRGSPRLRERGIPHSHRWQHCSGQSFLGRRNRWRSPPQVFAVGLRRFSKLAADLPECAACPALWGESQAAASHCSGNEFPGPWFNRHRVCRPASHHSGAVPHLLCLQRPSLVRPVGGSESLH